MRIACWISKATGTHSEYVLLTAFPLQQWLQQCASMLRYTILPVLLMLNLLVQKVSPRLLKVKTYIRVWSPAMSGLLNSVLCASYTWRHKEHFLLLRQNVFPLRYDLRLKADVNIEHRAWSTVNITFWNLRDIYCKSLRLRYIDGRKSVAMMRRNCVVHFKILGDFWKAATNSASRNINSEGIRCVTLCWY
jgi:hypothetical protein